MSRITVSDIPIGTPFTITEPNATLASIRTASADIGSENVSPDGLHRRNFALGSVIAQPDGDGYINSSTPTTVTTGTATLLQVSGTDQTIGAFDYDSTDLDEWIIGCSLEYWGDNTGHSGTDGRWSFQLAYSTDWNGSSGTWTLITNTLRRVQTAMYDVYCHGSISWMHRFTQYVGASSNLHIGLMVWEPFSGSTRSIEVAHTSLFMLNVQR